MARLYYQGHGSYRITLSDGRVIYVDPFAGDGYEHPADVVLVTHQHADHNKLSLVTKKPDCRVITNSQALEGGKHGRFLMDGIEIQSVMAKNIMHSPKKCVGYLIFLDGVSIYASGDTSKTEKMKDFAALSLDYAILCCDGIFNMGLRESAECAALIGARHNIPVHMGMGRLFRGERLKKWKAPNPLIIAPGREIELIHGDSVNRAYPNENVLNYVFHDELQVTSKEGSYTLTKQSLGQLCLPSGRVVANDPCCLYQIDEFSIAVEPGSYPVSVHVACSQSGEKRVALAMIAFSGKRASRWEMALVKGQSAEELSDGGFYGYGVDSGIGGFMDKQTADRISQLGLNIYDLFEDQFDDTYVRTYSYAIGGIDGGGQNDVAAFSSGWGDGCYPSYFGFAADGEPCALVTDFLVLD